MIDPVDGSRAVGEEVSIFLAFIVSTTFTFWRLPGRLLLGEIVALPHRSNVALNGREVHPDGWAISRFFILCSGNAISLRKS